MSGDLMAFRCPMEQTTLLGRNGISSKRGCQLSAGLVNSE